MRTAALVIATVLCARAQPDLARARAAYQRTEYQTALRLLGADSAYDALLLAGKATFQLGEYKRSQELLDRARQAQSRSEAYHWLGKAIGRRAETANFLVAPKLASECRKAFEKAVEIDPRNLEAWNDLYEYYLEAPGFLGGGPEKAEAALAKIAALDAVEGEFARAKAAEKKKDFATAERCLRKATEMAPTQQGRLFDLARFLAKRGRAQESDAVLAKAAAIAPDNPVLDYTRAETLIEGKRNPAEARKLLERYIASTKLTPDDPSREEARKLLRRAGGQ
ncbi:MAG: hypothetical protein U0Q16_08415 [Bryobacteraceae bacterium]